MDEERFFQETERGDRPQGNLYENLPEMQKWSAAFTAMGFISIGFYQQGTQEGGVKGMLFSHQELQEEWLISNDDIGANRIGRYLYHRGHPRDIATADGSQENEWRPAIEGSQTPESFPSDFGSYLRYHSR